MLSIGCKGKDLLYRLDELVDAGWVTRQKHKSFPLFVYSYSKKTQYDQYWTDLTKFARGVILDTEGNLVAKPFTKAFNIGEPSAPELPKGHDYMAYSKVDGSMSVFWHYEGKWNCSTKGSFDNQYTDYALSVIGNQISSDISKDITLITEVVLPEELDDMRRAAPADPGLYFLGATHTPSRKDLNPLTFHTLWGGKFASPCGEYIEDLMEKASHEEGTEGWVIRYSDGLRFKVKTAWYLRIFRTLSRLDDSVKTQMLQGMSLDQILVDVPEELTGEITELYKTISSKVSEIKLAVWARYKNHCGRTKPDRKTFAGLVKEDLLRSLLFLLYDEKDISSTVMDGVIKGKYD